jgi:hypothetical protein
MNFNENTQSVNDYGYRYIAPFIYEGASQMMSNVETIAGFVTCNNTILPTTLNDKAYHSSYVVSPYNALVDYSLEEVHKIQSPTIVFIVKCLIVIQAALLKLGKVNKLFCINNYLLSTNLYPEISHDSLAKITKNTIKDYPRHAICWRSLNQHSNQLQIKSLKKLGYHFIPTRQVYLFDKTLIDYSKKNNYRNDARLLKNSSYKIASHEQITEEDYERIKVLYSMLYLDKYSRHNPQFSTSLIAHWHKNDLLHFIGIRNQHGILDGIIGIFENSEITTAPLVGYDTSLPQKLGLYRMLIFLVLKYTKECSKYLNLSSGASLFKRLRGGVAFIEYQAVYTKHLPLYRKLLWHGLAITLKTIFVPLLKKYKL